MPQGYSSNHNIHHIFSDLFSSTSPKHKIGNVESIRAVMARRSPGCNSSWSPARCHSDATRGAESKKNEAQYTPNWNSISCLKSPKKIREPFETQKKMPLKHADPKNKRLTSSLLRICVCFPTLGLSICKNSRSARRIANS